MDVPQLIKNRNYVKFRGASGNFQKYTANLDKNLTKNSKSLENLYPLLISVKKTTNFKDYKPLQSQLIDPSQLGIENAMKPLDTTSASSSHIQQRLKSTFLKTMALQVKRRKVITEHPHLITLI